MCHINYLLLVVSLYRAVLRTYILECICIYPQNFQNYVYNYAHCENLLGALVFTLLLIYLSPISVLSINVPKKPWRPGPLPLALKKQSWLLYVTGQCFKNYEFWIYQWETVWPKTVSYKSRVSIICLPLVCHWSGLEIPTFHLSV